MICGFTLQMIIPLSAVMVCLFVLTRRGDILLLMLQSNQLPVVNVRKWQDIIFALLYIYQYIYFIWDSSNKAS